MHRALVLIAIFSCACSNASEPRGAEPGTDLYAVAPEGLREILYTSSERKVYAYRWEAGQQYAVLSSLRVGGVRTCESSRAFDEAVAAIAQMPVVKTLEGNVESYRGEWGYLSIRDETDIGPIEVHIRLPAAAQDSLVIESQGKLFQVAIKPSSLLAVAKGCE